MRIAQIAPLYESVPPKCYGGTERVVSWLTEELVELGHDVTLFASGDSSTRARLVPQVEESIRLGGRVVDSIALHVAMAERVFGRADEFDVIHSHIDYFPYSLMRRCDTPGLTTLHGRLDLPDLVPIYEEFADVPLVSISEAQRFPLPWVNWQGTVHHGLPSDAYRLYEEPGDYLAFLGRICPEKRVDIAIEVAKAVGIELKIAAKVDPVDVQYFESTIKPLLDHPLIEYVGEIDELEKRAFLGEARALLFPIDWPEPFGLVMIESMACGTPVIAHRAGSVPEVVEHGVTGFVVDSRREAIDAVDRISLISRGRCREIFEERFSVRRMARDYLRIYQRLAEGRRARVSVIAGLR